MSHTIRFLFSVTLNDVSKILPVSVSIKKKNSDLSATNVIGFEV